MSPPSRIASDPNWRQVIDALEAGAVDGIGATERVDTHAAHVFLAGERAYKLKRPVALSVLDFTTFEARKDALDAELRLNRRTAPDLYLEVGAITREAGGFALDGGGEPVEPVLVMRRFEQSERLDRIADRGPLAADLVARLGAFVAWFHDEAAAVRADQGGASAMAEVVRGNREDLEAAPAGTFDPALVAAVDEAARTALDRHGALLDRRRAHGFVRHCHGDLHLANIVTLGERVVPFDCVEFSEAIACCDTMYDLAFLLMDLVERDQRPAAWRVLDAYLHARRDIDGLKLLPLFMAVRATIRAKVTALGIAAAADPAVATSKARHYLAQAKAFLPSPKARVVAVGGRSGTGKTTLARVLAPVLDPAPGALLVRSDIERKRLAGVSETTRLDRGAYSPERRAACSREVCRVTAMALAAGWSVVVDAVHHSAAEREAVEKTALEAGARFDGLWLEAGAALLVERVTARSGDASDADAATVRTQLATDPGTIGWRRVDAGGTAVQTAIAAMRALDLEGTGAGDLARAQLQSHLQRS